MSQNQPHVSGASGVLIRRTFACHDTPPGRLEVPLGRFDVPLTPVLTNNSPQAIAIPGSVAMVFLGTIYVTPSTVIVPPARTSPDASRVILQSSQQDAERMTRFDVAHSSIYPNTLKGMSSYGTRNVCAHTGNIKDRTPKQTEREKKENMAKRGNAKTRKMNGRQTSDWRKNSKASVWDWETSRAVEVESKREGRQPWGFSQRVGLRG
jgi:hypothetical protein